MLRVVLQVEFREGLLEVVVEEDLDHSKGNLQSLLVLVVSHSLTIRLYQLGSIFYLRVKS